MAPRFFRNPREDLYEEVDKQLANRTWDTFDVATQEPRYLSPVNPVNAPTPSRYTSAGKGVFMGGQRQSYPADVLNTQENVATATNAGGNILKQVGRGGSASPQSYMGNRWQTAAPPPGSTEFYARNRARLDRSTESPYRAEIVRAQQMADQQAADVRTEKALKLRYLDPAVARADATRYGIDQRTGLGYYRTDQQTGLGYDRLGLQGELGRGNLAARQGSLAERTRYHEATLKQNREIADMTDDRARQVIANNLSRDTNHQAMEQQRFALESRVRNLTDVDKAAIGHLDKLTIMATAIQKNIESGDIPTANDAEKAAAIKEQTDAIQAYQSEVVDRLKAIAPAPVAQPAGTTGGTAPTTSAVDVNQNGIADSDEQALAWAKENAKTNPIKAKAITDAMKRKYPQVYGG